MAPKRAILSNERLAMLQAEAPNAFRFARLLVGDPSIAEEAVQETFLRLLRRPPADLGSDSYRRYFVKAVCGEARKLARGRRRAAVREEAHMRSSKKEVPAVDQTVQSAELTTVIREAIEALPLPQREVVCACYELGLSQDATASLVNRSQSTVSLLLKRALDNLRGILRSKGYSAATPLAVGELIRSLGVPPPPASLKASLETMTNEYLAGHIASSGRTARMTPAGATRGKAGSALPLAAPTVLVVGVLGAIGVALWVHDAGTSGPPPGPTRKAKEQVAPPLREAIPTPAEEKKVVPLEFGAEVFLDDFGQPGLDAFWTERLPAWAPLWFRGSCLLMAAGRRADGRPCGFRMPRGKEYRVPPRAAIVSRPIALGGEGLALYARHGVAEHRSKGSWEWGSELLAEDGRTLARIYMRPGRKWGIRVGDRTFGVGGKGRVLIATPHGEVWLCDTDGKRDFRVVARERLRLRLSSIRIRLFAAIPERSAGGGTVLAEWDGVVIRRVRLGGERPSGPRGGR